jgi:hypothetical protein
MSFLLRLSAGNIVQSKNRSTVLSVERFSKTADGAASGQLHLRVPLSHFWLRQQQHAFAETKVQ